MVTANDIKRRLSLLEVELIPTGKTHYAWRETGTTVNEAEYRKQHNIPTQDKVLIIGWGQ